MKKRSKGAFRHLAYAQRVLIDVRTGEPGSTLARVAGELGLPRSTVMREIKANSTKRPGNGIAIGGSAKRDAACPLLSKWPFCCNRCGKASCSRDRLTYRAADAERMAAGRRKKASGKPKPSSKRAIEVVDETISPLIQKGYSVEAAIAATGCDVPASTIRLWIDAGLLRAKRIDMPRAVRFYNRKYAPKRDKAYVPARLALGRTMKDCEAFMAAGRHFAVQVDTVIGNRGNGHAVLTVMDPGTKLQVCVRVRKTASSVNAALLSVWEAFRSAGCPFDAVLTDNGSEFQGLPGIETDESGALRFRVFYCDPYRSGQKGACERNHEILRYCIKKGESIDALAPEQVLDACSKINSYPRRSLGMLTPFDAFSERHAGGKELFEALGLRIYALDQIDFKKR